MTQQHLATERVVLFDERKIVLLRQRIVGETFFEIRETFFPIDVAEFVLPFVEHRFNR